MITLLVWIVSLGILAVFGIAMYAQEERNAEKKAGIHDQFVIEDIDKATRVMGACFVRTRDFTKCPASTPGTKSTAKTIRLPTIQGLERPTVQVTTPNATSYALTSKSDSGLSLTLGVDEQGQILRRCEKKKDGDHDCPDVW